MGRTSSAVFWGYHAEYWANPALLGQENGMRYDYSEIPMDVFANNQHMLTSRRVAIGYAGIGLAFSDGFNDKLGRRVDYRIDPSSDIYAYELANSYSAGFSLTRFLDTVIPNLAERRTKISHYLEVMAGYGYNKFSYFNLTDLPFAPADEPFASADTRDYGIFMRLSPYNTVESEGFMGPFDRLIRDIFGGLRLDFAYCKGEQNYQETAVTVTDRYEVIYVPTRNIEGWSLHVATGFPQRERNFLESHKGGWLADMLCPLVSYGYTWERWDKGMHSSQPFVDDFGPVKQYGWELTLCNIFSIRQGNIEREEEMDVELNTFGWGIGLEIGNIIGARYDKVTFPDSKRFGPAKSESYTIFAKFPLR